MSKVSRTEELLIEELDRFLILEIFISVQVNLLQVILSLTFFMFVELAEKQVSLNQTLIDVQE